MRLEGVIRALLFDVGWTLIYPKPTRKEAAEKYLLALGYSILPEDSGAAHRIAVDFYQSHRWQPEAIRNIARFWNEYYWTYVNHLGIDDPSLPMRLNKHAKRTIQYHLYPESLPVLHELRRRGYFIGAVSNWSTELPDILNKLGLIDAFDALVVSDVIGYHKPQPEIFQHALRSLGIHPEETVHIGDDLKADADGALRAGIRPIWLDRDGKAGSNLFLRVDSLSELLTML